METTILVKSNSREEPYTVSVAAPEAGLSIFCNCPAGEWGKYCKHKIAIILADEATLYDEKQFENFKKITEWISKSKYPALIAELRGYEKEVEIAKKKAKNHKDKIARLMKEGLK